MADADIEPVAREGMIHDDAYMLTSMTGDGTGLVDQNNGANVMLAKGLFTGERR